MMMVVAVMMVVVMVAAVSFGRGIFVDQLECVVRVAGGGLVSFE